MDTATSSVLASICAAVRSAPRGGTGGPGMTPLSGCAMIPRSGPALRQRAAATSSLRHSSAIPLCEHTCPFGALSCRAGASTSTTLITRVGVAAAHCSIPTHDARRADGPEVLLYRKRSEPAVFVRVRIASASSTHGAPGNRGARADHADVSRCRVPRAWEPISVASSCGAGGDCASVHQRLRLGELLRLRVEDIEDGGTVLQIRESKFHKSRIVPLSDSTRIEVRQYLQAAPPPSPSPRRIPGVSL